MLSKNSNRLSSGSCVLVLALSSYFNSAAFCLDPLPVPAVSDTKASGKYIQQTAREDKATADEHFEKKANQNSIASNPHLTLLDSIEIQGWEAQAAVKLDKSASSLTMDDGKVIEEVDGKASSILLEYGLTQAFTKTYKRGQRLCKLNLFRFGTTNGAYGAYSTLREGSSTIVIRGQASSEDQDSISFVSSNYLVFLNTGSDSDEEAKECLSKLADRLSARLPKSSGLPAQIVSLPNYEKLRGSEKFFMGPNSANHFANMPFIDALLLERSSGAAYADYQYSRPMAERLKLLLAFYDNPGLARESFSSYTKSMESYSRKTIERTETEFECKISDGYLMCGLNGNRVFVIAGARKAGSPMMLARDLLR